jgi:FKBP-type peptidyl-prolyl cis-trans isomerase
MNRSPRFALLGLRCKNSRMQKNTAIVLTFSLALAVGLAASAQTSTKQPSAQKPATPAASAQPVAQPSPSPSPTPDNSPFKTTKEKASYAIGMQVGGSLHKQGVDVDPNILLQGMKDSIAGKPQMNDEEARAALMALQGEMRAKAQAAAEVTKKEGEAFLAANKSKPGVTALPSGLQYKIMTPGTGAKPAATDKVVCNYRGTLINGTEFDASEKHGGPATFPVNGVIKGWTEALQLMPVGSKWQLFVPPDLAYGERGTPDGAIPPNSTLVFEVELVSIQK